jgi:hypothetical protein
MNESLETKGAAPPVDEAQPPEYQPPAIAWEEPLEAIAAGSCVLGGLDLDCQGATSQG